MGIHTAVVGNVSTTEHELLGGPGPWFIRDYPAGAPEMVMGEIAAISGADGLVYGWVSGDANLGTIKGVVLEDKALDAGNVKLLVLGHINRDQVSVGGAAPDAAALLALEERQIYVVG